jgi:hypothetical protein
VEAKPHQQAKNDSIFGRSGKLEEAASCAPGLPFQRNSIAKKSEQVRSIRPAPVPKGSLLIPSTDIGEHATLLAKKALQLLAQR